MIIERQILEKLTPDVQTLLWLTEGPLSTELPHFTTVNYLTDGLLKQHIQSHSEDKPCEHLALVHRLNDKPFYVFFQQTGPQSEANLMKAFNSLINKEARQNILVLGSQTSNHSLLKALEQAFQTVLS